MRVSVGKIFYYYKKHFHTLPQQVEKAAVSLDFEEIIRVIGEDASWSLATLIFNWHNRERREFDIGSFNIREFPHVTNIGNSVGGNLKFRQAKSFATYIDMKKVFDMSNRVTVKNIQPSFDEL